MSEYVNILKTVENENHEIRVTYDLKDPIRQIQNKKRSIGEKISILFILIYFLDSLSIKIFTDFITTKLSKRKNDKQLPLQIPRKVKRFFVLYLIKTHIRRQLSKINQLYLREILSQNNYTSDEIEKLRKSATDMKNYLDILPNVKKAFSSIVGVFGAVGAVIGIISHFDSGSLFKSLNASIIIDNAIIIVVIGIIVAFVSMKLIAQPIMKAFGYKRALFLKTKSWYHYMDVYLGKEKQLYSNSIYKLEDDLYLHFDAKNQKPKELPIDLTIVLCLRGSILGAISAFIIYDILTRLANSVDLSSTQLANVIGSITLIVVFGVWFFITPWIEYQRRRENNLL